MSEETLDIVEPAVEWKPRVIIIGAVLGALVGAAAGYLFMQNQPEEGPPEVSAVEGVKLGVLVFGLLRSIAGLGQ